MKLFLLVIWDFLFSILKTHERKANYLRKPIGFFIGLRIGPTLLHKLQSFYHMIMRGGPVTNIFKHRQ